MSKPLVDSQEKSNQAIDLTFKFKTLQQCLEQEEAEHKATTEKLADKSQINQSIEEAKSEAVKGERRILDHKYFKIVCDM